MREDCIIPAMNAYRSLFNANIFRKELQTEPLDLTISRVCGGRIEPPDASIAETSGGQAELSETDQEDAARSLNLPIQEASREQTGVGDMPKKIWFMKYQNEASNNQILRRKHPEKTIHTGEKRFKCEMSKKDFDVPSSIYMMNHTGEKQYSCPQYGKNFTHTTSLNAHKKIHTGKKSYQNETSNNQILKRKQPENTTHTGKKRFKCEISKKDFVATPRTHTRIIRVRSRSLVQNAT
uniref:C2H2-type domain-containing protein n=1 Tax=Loa loa TaxID=7209 RepID=A0A1I7W5P9_LOALO